MWKRAMNLANSVAGLTLWFGLGVTAAAQQATVEIGPALTCFERRAQDPGAACERGTPSAIAYLNPLEYSRPTIEAVLDAVIDLAINSPNQRVRREAIVVVGTFGRSADYSRGVPIVPRLERAYDMTRFDDVRALAVDLSKAQANRSGAAGFLERVAREPASVRAGADFTLAESAVLGLAKLGVPGRAALHRLAAGEGVPAGSRVPAIAAHWLERPPDRWR